MSAVTPPSSPTDITVMVARTQEQSWRKADPELDALMPWEIREEKLEKSEGGFAPAGPSTRGFHVLSHLRTGCGLGSQQPPPIDPPSLWLWPARPCLPVTQTSSHAEAVPARQRGRRDGLPTTPPRGFRLLHTRSNHVTDCSSKGNLILIL